MSVAVQAERALQAAGITGLVSLLSPVAPVVSPMCRAADWDCLRVDVAGAPLFLKLRSADAAGFVGVDDAAAGARAAADAGVGPAVRFALPALGAMALDFLPPPWREARLSDLANPDTLADVLAAKRTLHRAPVLGRVWDVFERIGVLAHGLAGAPADLPLLLAAVGEIGLALRAAGRDSVPCHADGVASNIMIGPAGAIRLVDFDCAGMADPHYDIGVVLNEACAVDADWAAAREVAFSGRAAREINRCRVYGVADDLLWGLWGLSAHARSERTALEFLKYGYWRLLRCRMALRHPDHTKRLQHL